MPSTQPPAHIVRSEEHNAPFYGDNSHPNYLNVACLPFAQQFYSLDSYNELVHPVSSTTAASTPPTQAYTSVFSK